MCDVVEEYSEPRHPHTTRRANRALIPKAGSWRTSLRHTHHCLAFVVRRVCQAKHQEVEQVVGVLVHVAPEDGVASIELAGICCRRIEKAPLYVLHKPASHGPRTEVDITCFVVITAA
eukprot:7390148-Prymnesium_polylepis.1